MPFLRYSDARLALARGETSCERLVSFFLDRIATLNPGLNAFIEVDAEGSLAEARRFDTRLAAGDDLPLAGLVLAVKDLICVAGRRVTCSSRILESFRSSIEATAVERLRQAGAIVIGKTNCDEFGMGSSNENSAFGPVRHPLDPTRVPGGSSGGSAAAVAAGLCHAALGTDTGGSIRQPAAFCGIVGLKPTYGRVSRWGLVAYASSFDTIGPMTPETPLTAQLLTIMAGEDPKDATSSDEPVADWARAATEGIRGLRVGLPTEYFADGLDPAVRAGVLAAVDRLASAGAEIVDVSLPHTQYGIAAYYVLTTAEASSNLARYDGIRYGRRAANARDLESVYTRSRSEGFGDEVKRRIMLGTYVLSSGYYDAYYARAQRARALFRRDFDEAFARVDVLATPATPGPAFRAGAHDRDPLAMYLEDVYTVGANLAGIPAISVPCGTMAADGVDLPVGIQFLAPRFREDLLFRVAGAV